MNISDVVAKASLATVTELQHRQNDIRKSVQGLYRPLIKDFSQQVQQHFVSNFTDLRESDKPSTWTPIGAKKHGTIRLFQDNFNEMADSLQEEAATILDEDLTDTYEESYNRELWVLYQMGVDTEDADSIGGFDAKKALLIAAGVGGVSYLARLNTITTQYKSQFGKVFKASVNGGLTLGQSLNQIDAVSNSLVSRVTSLAENEVKRAGNLGSFAATSQYDNQLKGSVWVARDSACPICRSFHMKITEATPSDSSHPGCRCWKVPIALDYTGRPIDYVAFLKDQGKR